ncbi:hypothetical protein KFL_003080070 [Klebsormidium nitens]|uniref:Uncharacterized protein n=1 Tax=Klebsormidium nitens TaxID=105231 RepID=A0A1Y1IDF8_KLENI|nr:hypothetical protein KFL_003080070 [Klebsormidium nitens]|eukprot:GAQ86736.1 hypothetical protein KFL_003080070 [Klebsormidium nitens]
MAHDPAKHIIIKLDGSDEVQASYDAGRSAQVVLKALATKLRRDGTLRREGGQDVAGDEKKLKAGWYIYTPVEATATTSGAHEEPEWHRRFVMEKLDPLTTSLIRELSATRSASKAKTSEVDQLYQALHLRLLPYKGDPTWEEVMALHAEGGEPSAFWDERAEPAQREAYVKVLEEKMAFAEDILEIRDARSKQQRHHHGPAPDGVSGVGPAIPICSCTVSYRFCGWRAALYYSGRGADGWHNITFRLFKGMDAFWSFFKDVAKTAVTACGTTIEPPASGEFFNPKRIKLNLPPGMTEDEVGEFVESYFNKDVANLDDLACFELKPFVPQEVLAFYG